MAITAEEDKTNWDWLPEPYGDKITAIREAVKRLWAQNSIKPQLPGFTPHGPEHSSSVEDIIHRLIPDRLSFKKLTERERFYLLASAWVHDVGMICGIEDGDSKLSPEDIRINHHKRSEKYIVNNYPKLCLDPEDAPAMSLVARFHGEDLESCRSTFPVGTEIVRLALIAAYLRLADALDITQSRSPSMNYAICLAYNIPMSSKLHWIKSRLISGIDISPKDHRITVDFKTLHNDCFHADKVPIQKQNLATLQKLVMNDLRNHIDSNSSVLIREGITYFLDVDYCSTEMEIDDQVRPELSRLVYNFEMMVHPSATKLMYILLETINDIIEPYVSGKDPKAKESMDAKLSEDLQRFINEIRKEILHNRPCHLGLKTLIEDFDELFHKNTLNVNDLKERVDNQLRVIEKERTDIRLVALEYFGAMNGTTLKISKYVEQVADELIRRKKVDSKTPLVQYLSNIRRDEANINVLLYGLSELVIKALGGLKDLIIKSLLKNNDIVDLVHLHKDEIEKTASTLIKMFVCEGQPKTITGKNDRLTYHDGTKYAIELHRRGFSNVVIIPDLVAGSLLNDVSREGGFFIDYVMLGVNGLEYIPTVSANPRNARFFHSGGHLAIAALTKSLQLHNCGKASLPRLILVLSRSKCAKNSSNQGEVCSSEADNTEHAPYILKEGYLFRTRKDDAPVRTQPFLIRDEDIRTELLDAGISLYNCREDSVMLSMVDDIIADGKYFIDIGKDDVLDAFRNWVYGDVSVSRSAGGR